MKWTKLCFLVIWQTLTGFGRDFEVKSYNFISTAIELMKNSYLVPERKLSSLPISASDSNFKPRNTQCIPAVKIIVFLDLNEKSWFSFGHYLSRIGAKNANRSFQREGMDRRNPYHSRSSKETPTGCSKIPRVKQLLNQDKPKAQGGKPSYRAVSPPIGRTAGPGMAMDAPTAKYFFGTWRWPCGVGNSIRGVLAIPVLTPFPHITEYVIEASGVW